MLQSAATVKKEKLRAWLKCTALGPSKPGHAQMHRFRSIFQKNNSKNTHISIYTQKLTHLLNYSIFKFICVYLKEKARRESDWEKRRG